MSASGAERVRDRRAERHAATRAEILAAAWAVVRDEGLAALSLREVAGRVGMRAPSLYSYFPSKHAIYDAMFAQGADDFRRFQAQLEFTGEALHDLRLSLRSFIEFCREDPSRYQLLFQRTIPGFEPSPESFAVAIAGLEETRAVFRAIGISEDEALDLATAIGTGLASQQLSNDPAGDRWVRLVDDAAEMFLEHWAHRATPNRKKAGR